MAVQGSVLFCWSWTKVSVLGSQVFEQALMEGCVAQLSGTELVFSIAE